MTKILHTYGLPGINISRSMDIQWKYHHNTYIYIYMYIPIYMYLYLVGGFNPSEKYESVGSIIPYGKMFPKPTIYIYTMWCPQDS